MIYHHSPPKPNAEYYENAEKKFPFAVPDERVAGIFGRR